MDNTSARFNVIEVISPHPKAGKVVILPCLPAKYRTHLPLRNAQWMLCNTTLDMAAGFAFGVLTERGVIQRKHIHHSSNDL